MRLGNMESSNIQKQSQGDKCPKAEMSKGQCAGGHDSTGTSVCITVNENKPNVSENLRSPNTPDTRSSVLSASVSDECTQNTSCDYVRKSRTHDCVLVVRPESPVSPENRDHTWTPDVYHHSKLVNSASLPEFGPTLQNTSANNREFIDYRNVIQQVPFVPSSAKSIPQKRIFLRKPKQAIKDLFVHKKHNGEKLTSLCSPCREYGPAAENKMNSSRCHECRTSHRMTHTFSDSSSEGCANVSEDALSLQSFGSQAGCGEIFADEEYLVSKASWDASETPKHSPVGFQGGTEQLASPAHPDMLDLFEIWETINKSLLSLSSVQEMNKIARPPSVSLSSKTRPTENDTNKNTTEQENDQNCTVTPKSDTQESTSDEGYCDWISAEDHTGQSLTPVFSRTFPRDTYSGDALYELFYDATEAEMTPIFDDELDLPSTIIGQPSPDLPLSMYSFHIGSEENVAPPVSVDLISHDFLQSNWVGKDCLLKLCDTEMSLAMGIINWMKHKSVNGNQTELRTPHIRDHDKGDTCREEVLTSALDKDKTTDFTLNKTCQVDVGHLFVGTTPETHPRTPTSRVCFHIFNSPPTPNQEMASPMECSPVSDTRSLFVLAINKESLCESCKRSFKRDSKEQHLCHSCISFIEQIKTSELWPHAHLYQVQFAGSSQALFPSPSSCCDIASDISILSLVEQCANQMSSLKLSQHQHPSNHNAKAITSHRSDICTKKYIRSKPKKKRNTTGNVGDDTDIKDSLNQTTPDVSQASRPTSLPLTSSTSSRFSKKVTCDSIKVRDKPCEGPRRDRKPTVIRDALSDKVSSEDKKMERKCRMNK